MNRTQAAELERLRPYLIEKFEGWIYEQRKIHLANVRPLSSQEKSRLGRYFEERILDKAQVACVDRISNPKFYDDLANSGIPIPLDFSSAVGLTLADCILIRRELCSHPPSLISTIFHELVHVVQIDILGLRKHIELYADSLMQGDYQYHSVIFEKQAYDLSDKFVRERPRFSVSEIVKKELKRAGHL